MPHMHVRGKAFRYTAIYPDGKKEILLDVPHYDFNWQNSYEFAEPKRMPKGTKMYCEAWFDNSAEQPGQSRSDQDRPLGRPDLGRDDDRLLRGHARRSGLAGEVIHTSPKRKRGTGQQRPFKLARHPLRTTTITPPGAEPLAAAIGRAATKSC